MNLYRCEHSVQVSLNFKYYTHREILVEEIKQFYSWFQDISEEEKQRVLNNIIAKMSTIDTTIEDELPF